MKKFSSLEVPLETIEYPGQYVLNLTVLRTALARWCAGLSLLQQSLTDSLVLSTSRSDVSLSLMLMHESGREQRTICHVAGRLIQVNFSVSDFGYLYHFLLKYFRDDVAEVDHLDIEAVLQGSRSGAGYITIQVLDASAPMTPEQASEWLDG